SATEPASAEKPPPPYITSRVYTNRPSTIDGADSRMSLTKRTTVAVRLLAPYSASHVPAATPSGAPIRIARPHITAEPNSALRRPPSAMGGGVARVNRLTLMPLMPLDTRVHRIQARNTRPITAATHDSESVTALMMRRRR